MKIDIYYKVCNDLANEFINFKNRKRNYVNIYSFFVCGYLIDVSQFICVIISNLGDSNSIFYGDVSN